jgi:hypothetical protein
VRLMRSNYQKVDRQVRFQEAPVESYRSRTSFQENHAPFVSVVQLCLTDFGSSDDKNLSRKLSPRSVEYPRRTSSA